MSEDSARKAWKSTEQNPYRRIYCKDEKLNSLIPQERNIATLEDCAKYRTEWHECLKSIEGENCKEEKIHKCNDILAKYKVCVHFYKQVCFSLNFIS